MKFELTKACAEETPLLAGLIKEVWADMEHREWFAPEEDDDYIRRLISQGKGVVWKATETDTGRIAALFIIVYPGNDPENLGYDIGLPAYELNKVAHMDTVVVHPDFRGYGLQRQLALKAEEFLHNDHYRYLLCTVHPDNRFSRYNMEKVGYRCVRQVLKYGGLPRMILMKEIEKP